jgi:hypothetical protein
LAWLGIIQVKFLAHSYNDLLTKSFSKASGDPQTGRLSVSIVLVAGDNTQTAIYLIKIKGYSTSCNTGAGLLNGCEGLLPLMGWHAVAQI